MNDSIVTSNKTTNFHSKFWIFNIILLILALSGIYYLWKENYFSIPFSSSTKQKTIKIYNVEQKYYYDNNKKIKFTCILSIKYDDDPIINNNYYDEYKDKQKLIENCIPL
ncbi:hypothetical protein [Gilliamella sp. Bif1-4]|jgi:hypothetical protein|uniref:hypothetical protein n=1 Tax=Gilliamella sp. Bif1-4 TaxID=3120233 RepID=UPI00080E6920|nr:hypothetical protein [Gilliamella apicola]OCG38811.1 hypothetical protein A9G25_11920 [Gilliamella apicola]